MLSSDSESFLEVQSDVLHDAYEKAGAVNPVHFIIENAPLFRYFAENISPDVLSDWSDATKDKKVLTDIENRYDAYAQDIRRFIEIMDPDLQSELISSIQEGAVDKAALILESAAKLQRHGGDD